MVSIGYPFVGFFSSFCAYCIKTPKAVSKHSLLSVLGPNSE